MEFMQILGGIAIGVALVTIVWNKLPFVKKRREARCTEKALIRYYSSKYRFPDKSYAEINTELNNELSIDNSNEEFRKLLSSFADNGADLAYVADEVFSNISSFSNETKSQLHSSLS